LTGAVVLATSLSAKSADIAYGGKQGPAKHYKMRTSKQTLQSLQEEKTVAPLLIMSTSNYEDLRGRCEESVRDLRSALRSADFMVQSRPLDAANMLLAALVNKAKVLEIYDNGNTAIPNTIVAVETGAALSQTFFAGVDQLQMAPGVAVKVKPAYASAMKYNFVRSMVMMALKSHRELDKSFFEEIEKCHYKYYGEKCEVIDIESDSYGDKMGNVVQYLISVYQENREAMATDYFNLVMAQEFSQAAADLLSQSMFRRHYRHAILNFADAATDAQYGLQEGSYQVLASTMHYVDSRIDETISHLRPYEMVQVSREEFKVHDEDHDGIPDRYDHYDNDGSGPYDADNYYGHGHRRH
jgi:hypothetical protein